MDLAKVIYQEGYLSIRRKPPHYRVIQSDGMKCYADLNAFYQAIATPLATHDNVSKSRKEYDDESVALY